MNHTKHQWTILLTANSRKNLLLSQLEFVTINWIKDQYSQDVNWTKYRLLGLTTLEREDQQNTGKQRINNLMR